MGARTPRLTWGARGSEARCPAPRESATVYMPCALGEAGLMNMQVAVDLPRRMPRLVARPAHACPTRSGFMGSDIWGFVCSALKSTRSERSGDERSWQGSRVRFGMHRKKP